MPYRRRYANRDVLYKEADELKKDEDKKIEKKHLMTFCLEAFASCKENSQKI
jgi:hypothetical protein